MKVKQKALLACSIVLAAVALYTCVRIEIFNFRAGGYLPRHDVGEGNSDQWRTTGSECIRLAWEARFRNQSYIEGKLIRPTAEQEAEIEREIERAEENSDFRDFVSSWGQAQYLVAPLAMWLSMLIVINKAVPRGGRIIAAIAAAASACSIVLMFYRGYFTSLGW